MDYPEARDAAMDMVSQAATAILHGDRDRAAAIVTDYAKEHRDDLVLALLIATEFAPTVHRRWVSSTAKIAPGIDVFEAWRWLLVDIESRRAQRSASEGTT